MNQKEYKEACMFHNWLKVRRIRHFHVPNETGGNAKRGAMNKAVGVSSGVPDYFIFLPDGTNLAVELKAGDHSNNASENQKDWLRFLSERGFKCSVAYGFVGAQKFVQQFLQEDNEAIEDFEDNECLF